MNALAADLERALGRGHVAVSGGQAPAESTFEESILAEMNRQRLAYGLPPLRLNPKLSLAAGDRISDLFAKHYFEHVSPDGIQPWTWVEKRGYDYRLIGENLAVGYRSGYSVVDGWMHSPGHRANILGRDFQEVGVAVAGGSPTRPYSGPTVVAIYGQR